MFFLEGGYFVRFSFSKLFSGAIIQFKLYAVQFEEDYDYIRPIYYFMWLLMILCTRPILSLLLSQ